MPNTTDDDGVWVKTEPTIDGQSFMVTIEFTGDRAIALDRRTAADYAYAVLNAAAHADYDAAVMKQMTEKVDPENAIQLVMDMREDRPPLDLAPTSPMSLVPGVNKELKPFLRVEMDGKAIGQWTPDDARGHAMNVLEAVLVADLDAVYLRTLKGLVHLEDHVARNVIEDLVNWRDDS